VEAVAPLDQIAERALGLRTGFSRLRGSPFKDADQIVRRLTILQEG
jgi:hypothetical protein